MKLRPRHLACLILLLSSLSAEASVRHSGDYRLGSHYINVLLAQEHAGITTDAVPEQTTRDTSHLDLPVALLAQHRTAWTMRPPSAHSLQLQAVTSFLI